VGVEARPIEKGGEVSKKRNGWAHRLIWSLHWGNRRKSSFLRKKGRKKGPRRGAGREINEIFICSRSRGKNRWIQRELAKLGEFD